MRRLFFLPAFLFFISPLVSAETSALNDQAWQETLSTIRSESSSVLEENRKLKAENQMLEEAIAELQAQYQQAEEENRTIVQQIQRMDLMPKEAPKPDEGLSRKVDFLEKQVDEKKAEAESLKIQLQTFDQKKKILELQNSDLQLQKDTLALGLKDQNNPPKQEIAYGNNNSSIKKLKSNLQESQRNEQQLSDQVARLKNIQPSSPDAMKDFTDKQQALTLQLKDLQSQKKQLVQENELLKREYLNALRLAEIGYPEVSRKKEELETQVKQLEGQIESINGTVETAATVQTHKRQLINEMMTVDRENQELRKKIETLKK